MSTQAFITGRLLRWARQRDGLSLEDAAKVVSVTADRISAWEEGEERPTLKKAEALAHRLNVPLSYLFLSEPPVETIPLPDLRTVAGEPPTEPSPDLLWVINDALSKQEWYREYLQESGSSPVALVGSVPQDADPIAVASSICLMLSVDEEMRAKATSWDNFLTLFVRQCEAKGVIVLRSGIVGNNTSRRLEVSEFRGFAIVDELAPIVFVNSRDAKVAQIFTLAHEVAHLWIGQSGVSNPNYRVKSSDQSNAVERLCNRVAAEVLVPAEGFLQRWDDGSEIHTNITRLSPIYRVSRFVLLRRAFELNKITQETYWDYYDEFISQAPRGSKDEGGNFYNNLLAKSSTRLTAALLSALARGSVSYRDAAQLLNIKVGQLDTLRDNLMKQHAVT